MEKYICKPASENEMHEKWNYEIAMHPGESNWNIWKDSAIRRVKNGQSITYYGILDGKIISEATALLDPKEVQNSEGLVDEKTVYLSAFRTNKEYRGKGYFSKLFRFLLSDLASRGYKRVTLGVEPHETENMQIYFHYGFTDFIKLARETYPDGETIDVIYYGKDLGQEKG
jgi:GNAT superfamily N-acetyltransferase